MINSIGGNNKLVTPNSIQDGITVNISKLHLQKQLSNPENPNLQTFIHIFDNVYQFLRQLFNVSFQILKPYVFSIICVMKGGTGIPIGYIFAPTETNNTYDDFFTHLGEIIKTHEEGFYNQLKERFYFQSDGGKALLSFYKPNNFKYCFCHVHIVRKFGTNSKLRNYVIKALQSRGPQS